MPPIADGSSKRDAPELVIVDRRGPERYRWRCPNGHVDWSRTNNHLWCSACSRQSEQGADIHPEHWEVHDQKNGETIPWSAVQLIE